MYADQARLKLILNVTVLMVALYGLSHKDFEGQKASFFDRIVIGFLAPIQQSVTDVERSVFSFFDHYVLLTEVSQQNDKLRQKIQQLETTVAQQKELKRENARLKKLLGFDAQTSFRKVLAQVVSWDPSRKFKVLRINKGLKDGIELQSTVVTAEGVLGYIYRATDHYADVLTILDQNNRVDSLVARTRSHGIVEGFSDNRCLMKYVTRTEPVELNDIVLTSGLSHIYPKGLKVGRISKIERESYGITQFIQITPSVDFQKIEEVIVLVGEQRQQIQEEMRKLDQTRALGGGLQ